MAPYFAKEYRLGFTHREREDSFQNDLNFQNYDCLSQTCIKQKTNRGVAVIILRNLKFKN